MGVLLATAGVSSRTGKGSVSLHHGGDRVAQCSSEEARTLALSILRAADCADSDAFLFNHFTKKLRVAPRKVMSFVKAFRQWRASEIAATGK